jgi:hypothetical protein
MPVRPPRARPRPSGRSLRPRIGASLAVLPRRVRRARAGLRIGGASTRTGPIAPAKKRPSRAGRRPRREPGNAPPQLGKAPPGAVFGLFGGNFGKKPENWIQAALSGLSRFSGKRSADALRPPGRAPLRGPDGRGAARRPGRSAGGRRRPLPRGLRGPLAPPTATRGAPLSLPARPSDGQRRPSSAPQKPRVYALAPQLRIKCVIVVLRARNSPGPAAGPHTAAGGGPEPRSASASAAAGSGPDRGCARRRLQRHLPGQSRPPPARRGPAARPRRGLQPPREGPRRGSSLDRSGAVRSGRAVAFSASACRSASGAPGPAGPGRSTR